MRIFRPAALILSISLALFSCNKVPETSFTYMPMDNPEAGEYIQFENTTPEAKAYAWDFGDGSASTQENPEHEFEEAGSYNVTLTATNDAGDQPLSKSITINDPTILAFYILDSTEFDPIPLEGAEIWLYDNESDWDNFEEPLLVAYSDENGEALFMNMEDVVYYIWAIKEESNGFWYSGGFTDVITLNETTSYSVPCIWEPDEVTKAAAGKRTAVKLIRR